MEKNHSFTAIILPVVLFFLSVLLPACSCMASPAEETNTTITMSIEKYNEQLETLKKQEKVLLRLKKKMDMLEMPLTEQAVLLEKCEKELEEAKSSLEKQEVSLTRLSNSIETLKQDLKVLQKQIEALKRQSRRRGKQRNFYGTALGILGSMIIIF